MPSDIDLHCHSTASDGAMAPELVVARAHERGVATLAITDHDTVAGFRCARALSTPVRLISGIELSCVWQGMTLHIVGLNFDAEHAVMRDAERHQYEVRANRSELIAERLTKAIGQPINVNEVASYAGGDIIGRPHFAQYLLDQGMVGSIQSAFQKYLGAGKIGDVKVGWPSLQQVVAWIVDSGGTAVMAHAHRYNMTRTKLCRCLDEFIEAGGQAMEVAYGLMSPSEQARMVELASRYELLGSCGSDFHAINRYGLDLGVMPAFPKHIEPVWNAF